jgi:hypothetical protein
MGPLQEIVQRSATSRKVALVGLGITCVVAGIVMIDVEYQPPLSREEAQMIGWGMGLFALALYSSYRAFFVADTLLSRCAIASRGCTSSSEAAENCESTW